MTAPNPVGDTPFTDSRIVQHQVTGVWQDYVHAADARSLERKLAEAVAENNMLRSANSRFASLRAVSPAPTGPVLGGTVRETVQLPRMPDDVKAALLLARDSLMGNIEPHHAVDAIDTVLSASR